MKPMPPGTGVATASFPVPAAQVGFIADTTAADAYGRPLVSQAIFDQMLAVVHAAREFIVLDYFLFNDEPATSSDAAVPIRALSKELRDALLAQRRAYPALRILFVTDPINTADTGLPSNDFAMLRAAGVDLVVTDRRRLRDASFLCANLWRMTIGRWRGHGRLESANHRRTLIADDGHGGLVGVVGSADPRDASSTYSNVAAKLSGPVLAPLLASELAIARFSGWSGTIGPAIKRRPQGGCALRRARREHQHRNRRRHTRKPARAHQCRRERRRHRHRDVPHRRPRRHRGAARRERARRARAPHSGSGQGLPWSIGHSQRPGRERTRDRERRRHPRALVSHSWGRIPHQTRDDLRCHAAVGHSGLGRSHAAQSCRL
jgi:hypothetical protein